MGMNSKKDGYEQYKEVMVFEGKDEAGNKVGREGFRSIVDHRFHIPEKGWNGEPPRPEGYESARHYTSEAYRSHYDQIDWN